MVSLLKILPPTSQTGDGQVPPIACQLEPFLASDLAFQLLQPPVLPLSSICWNLHNIALPWPHRLSQDYEQRVRGRSVRKMRVINTLAAATALLATCASGFAPLTPTALPAVASVRTKQCPTSTLLPAAVPDLDVVGLVAGQENYGLAIVCVGEALWSFLQAPSFDHAKIFIPATVASLVLVLVSGPMVTSGDASQVALGLEIATAVSVGLGASYIARMIAPYSPSPKEIAFLGLLVAIAGFFSFSQNLFVDGFVALPSIPLPTLPSIDLPF